MIRIAVELCTQSLIPLSMKNDLPSIHGSDFDKANKITSYIQTCICSFNKPVEYLIDVCNVLFQREDIRLKNIAASICEKLGKQIPQGMSSCRNYICIPSCMSDLTGKKLNSFRSKRMHTKNDDDDDDEEEEKEERQSQGIKAACARHSLINIDRSEETKIIKDS